MSKKKGFVFMRADGYYARIATTMTYKEEKFILWSKDIEDAYIFPHEAIAKRAWPELNGATALQVTEIRTVTLGWPLED